MFIIENFKTKEEKVLYIHTISSQGTLNIYHNNNEIFFSSECKHLVFVSSVDKYV